jgi:hypothetical protein
VHVWPVANGIGLLPSVEIHRKAENDKQRNGNTVNPEQKIRLARALLKLKSIKFCHAKTPGTLGCQIFEQDVCAEQLTTSTY